MTHVTQQKLIDFEKRKEKPRNLHVMFLQKKRPFKKMELSHLSLSFLKLNRHPSIISEASSILLQNSSMGKIENGSSN